MTHFEQAKKDGFTTIYGDTPASVERQIEAYNRQMGDCRVKRARLRLIEEGYTVLNLLLVGVITATEIEELLKRPLFFAPAAAVWAVCFLLFGIVNTRFLIPTAALIPLAILDWRFLILLGFDLFFAIPHSRIKGSLKNRPGYPAFADIKLIYEKTSEPEGLYDKENQK